MKIVLVGYMGSGKSTIGKIISKNVRIPFYDLDTVIEEKQQMTIKAIFETKGEIYFRKQESAILNSFLTENNSFVLALGGGTPCYANNVEVLQNSEIVSVYLKGSVETLTERLKNEKALRPLLASLTNEELEDYIRKHLFDRSYYYLQAKHVVSIDNKSIAEIVSEIENVLA